MWIAIVGIILTFVLPWLFFFVMSYLVKIPAAPKIERINLATIQDIDHKAFEETTQKLGREGFQHIGDFSVQTNPGTIQYTRVFTDKNKVVLVSCVYMAHGQAKNTAIVFETEFEDGTEVTTTNRSYPRVFKPHKKKFTYQSPKTNIKDLLEFHRQRIAEIGQGKFPRLIPGNLAETLIEDHKKQMQRQETFKIYKKNHSGEFYQPTIYGAAYIACSYWINTFLRYNPQTVKIKSSTLPEAGQELSEEPVKSTQENRVTIPEGQVAAKVDIAGENNSDDHIVIQQKSEMLQKQLSSGAGWFYFIAGLSLVNTVIAISGSEWGFIIGLAITQIIDTMGRELGTVGIIISLVFDITVAAGFIVFGVFANKKYKWAFITGMIVYALDTLLILAAQIWLALAFHIVALYYIFNGYRACRELSRVQLEHGAKKRQ
jgi:hypothetical protein